MESFLSTEVSSKANKWQGRNITRWRNADYDRIFHAAASELDPVKRADMMIQLNDMVVKNVVVIPLLFRMGVTAAAKNLHTSMSGWDNDVSDLANWYKDTNV
jgi:peptide/nickel transport system substrate-binding protein